MSDTLADEGARRRIATELEQNLCVEAGAGTGKTTVLVERVVNLLASGMVDVDQLVVITFTEKAAAELSTRVRDRLEARAQQTHGAERDRLLVGARELYRAHIETIHSFAAALLRERPVEAGIDPLFEVLQAVAADIRYDRAYQSFQDQLLGTDHPELARALRRGFGLQELRQTCDIVQAHRYLLPLDLPAVEDDGLVEEALAQYQAIAGGLEELLEKHAPPEDDGAVPFVRGILEWIDNFGSLEPLERERELVLGWRPRIRRNAGRWVNWGGEKPRLGELEGEYERTSLEAGAELRSQALLGLLPHVQDFVRGYERQRKDEGVADFDDLLIWARDLLRDSRAARRYFRDRFRAVLIDEFQDTDPVQTELVLLLTSEGDPPADWRRLRPLAGRLMVVGDPKQSIYRFRRADMALYDEVRAGALGGAEERISSNFRSNPSLLQALNAAFDRILRAEPGLQPANTQLWPPPGASPARRPPIVVAEGAVEGTAGEVREHEARTIAGLLATAHREGWEVRDRRDGGTWRPCRWGDMAILFPARTGIGLYEQALAVAGIPYRHEGARDFFEREEVRDLVWLLSAVDDPTDRLALVGALRSSAFAVSDEELVLHVAGGGALSYRSRATAESAPVNDGLAELRDLHDLRRRVSLGELVRRVVERSRLVEYAMTRDDGEQRAANLLAIVDIARLFAEAGGGGLRPFVRYLRNLIEQEQAEIDAGIAEETDDVVRLMTIHGAKGLEFPVVALANLGNPPLNERGPIPREAERFLHFRVGSGSKSRHGHYATPGYDDACQVERQASDAERLRLLYVGATRARDHLMIPCIRGRGAAPHLLGELVNALPDDESLVLELDAGALVAGPAETVTSWAVAPDELTAAEREEGRWRDRRRRLLVAASRERDIVTATSRERATTPLAAEVATFDAALMVSEGPPIPVGDAVHLVMERVTLPGADDLETIAEDVCLEGDIATELDDVVSMCRACLRAGCVRHALAGGGFWREVPFVVRRGGEGALTTGRVDLVHRDGDELVVIDYKTDKDVTEDTAEQYTRRHHAGQAEVYQQALAEGSGLPVREVTFVYCRAGVQVTLRPSADGVPSHDATVSVERVV
ncbi:MAG: UvrD-helicase domain-containing protein [Candidatus Dormibacteraeota bacterium]|nr:UvrD-helicase domain-containing protein [Candidatus Dormibacteraeota bacterium]